MTLPTADDLEKRVLELFVLWRVVDRSIEVGWNRRLRTSAGRAFVQHGIIELNPNLLAAAPDEIDGVLVHEAAHVAAFRLFGDAAEAHGRHWRALMRLAGEPPDIEHHIPITRKPRRPRYLYLRVCDACGDRRIMRPVRYGRCQGCSRRDSYLVLRTADSRAGRAALERMTLADARASSGTIMGGL